MMEILMDAQGLSIKQVISHPPNEEAVLEALKKTIKPNKGAAPNP
jgi:2-polyprenyl-3-methyl-5-hydroxy-6-metoxy-1,4-benzoquinol methylase